MKFENTKVWGFEHAIRGARNPLESWGRSDSTNETIGKNDMKLMQTLIKAAMKETNSHSKFLRQIMISVDITAPLYWWKEFDTYKVGTVANSTSTMHKIQSKPITLDCFEIDDYEPELHTELTDGDMSFHFHVESEVYSFIDFLESLRQKYLKTKDVQYWKELIRWLPESWLQTRTVTLNYQVARQMYLDRYKHKLTEWSDKRNANSFIKWIESLPYADELIMYETTKQQLTKVEKDALIELLENEQIMHMIPNNKYETEKYTMLEELKVKIKDM